MTTRVSLVRVVLMSRGIRDVQRFRCRRAAWWCGAAGFWSVGGGTAGTGEGNPGLLPEGGQVGCHRAGCRYGPQGLADDQGTLDRRVSGVPGRVRGVRLGDESGFGA